MVEIPSSDSISGQIILVLKENVGLSSKQIRHELLRQFNKEVSLQAVFKTLKKLIQRGIVCKKGREYQLNMTWISDIISFADELKGKFLHGLPILTRLQEIEKQGDALLFRFKTLSEHYNWWWAIDDKKLIERSKNKICCDVVEHEVWPVIFIERELKFHEEYSSLKHYTLIGYDTPLDREVANLFRKMGHQVLTGAKLGQKMEFHIIGDYIFEDFYPKSFNKKFHELFLRTKNLNELNLNYVRKLLNSKIDIRVVVIKDTLLAKRMADKVLAYFKKV